MLVIQKISKLDTSLGWLKLFFLAFRLKWKLELIFYFLVTLCLFILTFLKIPIQGEKTRIMMILAAFTGLMSGPLVYRSSRFSNVILRKLRIENHLLIPDKSYHTIYGIRIVLTKKELIECNCFNKEKIDELVKIFTVESGMPKYKFGALQGFKSGFFILLGSALTLIFRISEKDNFDSMLSLFSTIFILLLLIALVIYGVEILIIRDAFSFWVKRHYRTDIIRYLNEAKLMIPNPT